jgi:hypothetical protein
MRSIAKCLVLAVTVTAVTGFARPPAATRAAPATIDVKLGLETLTEKQRADLWRRADQYAMAEAFFKQCGKPAGIESRMTWAAQACIKPEALATVTVYFRRKVKEFSTRFRFDCESQKARAMMKTAREKIDKDVAEVRAMCDSCLIC